MYSLYVSVYRTFCVQCYVQSQTARVIFHHVYFYLYADVLFQNLYEDAAAVGLKQEGNSSLFKKGNSILFKKDNSSLFKKGNSSLFKHGNSGLCQR